MLALCPTAMQELELRDPALAGELASRDLLFVHDKRSNRVPGIFTIPEAYCVWGAPGIISVLVYACMKSRAYPGGKWRVANRKNSQAVEVRARSQTRQWLLAQKFPAELVEPFDAPGVA